MFLSNLSIKRPVLAIVVIIALLTVGAVSYSGLPINQYPDTETPIAAVSISQPGASAEQIESKVTKKVEEALAQISGVKHITSNVSEGSSMTTVEFSDDKDVDVAAQDVKDKISSIRGTLPSDINEPVIQKFDMSAEAILSLVVTGPASMSNTDLSQLVEDQISKKLNTVSGVGSVTTYGGQDREIHILLDKEKMAAYNLTTAEVTASLQKDNVDASSGKVSNGEKEVSLRTDGTIKEVNDFLDVLVVTKNGTEIHVKDIATVEDGFEDRNSISYYKGKEAIGVDIVKQSGQNTTQVAADLKTQISKIQTSLPQGVKINIVKDNSTTIQESVDEVKKTMIEGCVLAVIVVFIFLRNWGSTLISAVSLPTSIITTFGAMKIMGFSLNTMSLMGLSLAVGLLIDDAIVVIENIVRHMNMGKSAIQAARDGTSEIGLAVMATTFAVVAVFLPISLVEGMIGAYFKQFGITVAASVLVSLFVSFTLVPMLSSRYLKRDAAAPNKKPGILGRALLGFNNWFDSLGDVYTKTLNLVLRHRKKTLIIATALFFGSLTLLTAIPTSFMETTDNGTITISAETDGGTTLESAAKTTKRMEAILNKYPEVQYLYSTVTSSKISIMAKLPGKEERKASLSDVANKMRKDLNRIPGITLAVSAGSGVMSGKDVQIYFLGDDFNKLYEYTKQAEQVAKSIPGVVDVGLSYTTGKAEAKLDVDRDRAADLGVSPSDVASTLSTLFNGSTVTHYETEKGRYAVKVLLQDNQRTDIDSLKGIYVPGTNNQMIPLDQVTKQVFTTSSTSINRYDKARQIKIEANLVGITTGEFNRIFNQKLKSETKMPDGVRQSVGGMQEMQNSGIKNLVTALFMGILFIFLILAAQFESFVDPLAILFSLPLAIIGALLALFLSDSSLSMMAFIGVIMLMGLVTKNAILLIDNAKQRRAEGIDRTAALLQAGSTRLRPIVMTTLAMIFGMLPTAISTGTGSESRIPMAYTIIGGLISSTFLTLLVVPVVYTVLDDIRAKFKKKAPASTVQESVS